MIVAVLLACWVFTCSNNRCNSSGRIRCYVVGSSGWLVKTKHIPVISSILASQRLPIAPFCLRHVVLLFSWQLLAIVKTHASILFERSEFLIDTPQKKIRPSARVHACSTNLGFSVEKIVLVSVWGTSERLVPAKKKERLVPASASLPTAGSALPPVGRATPLHW